MGRFKYSCPLVEGSMRVPDGQTISVVVSTAHNSQTFDVDDEGRFKAGEDMFSISQDNTVVFLSRISGTNTDLEWSGVGRKMKRYLTW